MTIKMEVKKHALQQLQDGSWKLTLTVHHEDMSMEIIQAAMGAPYGMVMVPIDYDNPDVRENRTTEKSEGEKLRIRACALCNEQEFQKFSAETYMGIVNPNATHSRNHILSVCNIDKRLELRTNPEAQEKFKKLLEEFDKYKNSKRYSVNLERD